MNHLARRRRFILTQRSRRTPRARRRAGDCAARQTAPVLRVAPSLILASLAFFASFALNPISGEAWRPLSRPALPRHPLPQGGIAGGEGSLGVTARINCTS